MVNDSHVNMPPKTYDSTSAEEAHISLPSSPQIKINRHIHIQPPLTHRGTGPGLIVFLPDPSKLEPSTKAKALDPDPVQKWAEEGFSVSGVTTSEPEPNFMQILQSCCETLSSLHQVDTKGTFAALIHDYINAPSILSAIDHVNQMPGSNSRIACLIIYGFAPPSSPSIPTLLHLPEGSASQMLGPVLVVHSYESTSPYFILPQTNGYDPGASAIAHTRTLTFLRKHLGGPIFDLEAIWEEHVRFEFEVRSVARTMSTMVAEPYVNHIPTMTGGVGRQELTKFYRDHFIFSNPGDARLQVVSRTIGADRVVDEFIYHVTHSRMIDWLLPGVPPSGNKLSIPMLAVVNMRGDRIYHEHIWWDQATVLRQIGILPTHMSYITSEGQYAIRLPVAGAEAAAKLMEETSAASNGMLDWISDQGAC